MKSKLIFTAALLCVTLLVPISLFGQSQDFQMNGTVLVRYRESAADVTIPTNVTFIGDLAFYVCSNLKTVTVSRRTRIGALAFPSTARIVYSD